MTTVQTVHRIPTPALHPILGRLGMVLDLARDSVGFLGGIQQQYGSREMERSQTGKVKQLKIQGSVDASA